MVVCYNKRNIFDIEGGNIMSNKQFNNDEINTFKHRSNNEQFEIVPKEVSIGYISEIEDVPITTLRKFIKEMENRNMLSTSNKSETAHRRFNENDVALIDRVIHLNKETGISYINCVKCIEEENRTGITKDLDTIKEVYSKAQEREFNKMMLDKKKEIEELNDNMTAALEIIKTNNDLIENSLEQFKTIEQSQITLISELQKLNFEHGKDSEKIEQMEKKIDDMMEKIEQMSKRKKFLGLF